MIPLGVLASGYVPPAGGGGISGTWLDSGVGTESDMPVVSVSTTDPVLLIGVTNGSGTSATMGGVTVDDVASDELLAFTVSGSNRYMYFYTAEVTGGGPYEITMTATRSANPRIFVWSLDGTPTLLDTATSPTNNTNVTVDTLADDGFVAAISGNATSATTWTGATERADYTGGSAADTIPTGSTATLKCSGYLNAIAVVSLT